MAKHGKKYLDRVLKVDRLKVYSLSEGVALAKELADSKFDETMEIHLRTGADPRHADQQLRGVVSLPAGTGKSVRILALVEGEAVQFAEEAGADYVGIDEYVQKIQDGWLEFDVALAIPQVMGKIGRLGRVLGPRGLMPSPKAGSMVQPDELADTIRELRQGRVEYRIDRLANLHIPFGKASFTVEQLMENLTALLDAVQRAKPGSLKGRYIHRMTVSSTMGPGIRVDTGALG